MDHLPISRSIPTTCNPFPAKRRWLRLFWIVGGNVVQVKKRSFGRVAFFVSNHLNTHERPLVLQHLNKTGVRYLNKLLVVLLAHLDFLFPERVFPDTECPDSLAYQQSNNPTACRVQVGVDTAITLRRDLIKLARGKTLLFGKVLLMMCSVFVVVVIATFDRLSIHQTWDKSRFGGGESGKGIHPWIKSRHQLWIHCCLLFSFLIHHLHHIKISTRDDADLINGLPSHFRLDLDGQP